MEKYSKQREEIINFLKSTYTHPTAEEVYIKLKENGSTASRGTVYRNLDMLSNKEIILKIPVQDAPDRYDYIRDTHNHIICTKCSKAFDFYYDLNENALKKEILKQTNVELTSHTLTLYGICNECKIKSEGGI